MLPLQTESGVTEPQSTAGGALSSCGVKRGIARLCPWLPLLGRGTMRAGLLCLISFFTVTGAHDALLGRNGGIKTKRELIVHKTKHPGPVQEYELLLQVAYRDSKEKRDLKNFLKSLKPPSFWLHGPMTIIRAKATTHCSSLNGVLRCACEDGYTWFPPSCLDPQNCFFHMAGSLSSCECQLNNLSQSVNFCERTKVWGTFKINERFINDLLNLSSAVYYKYITGIEMQLKKAYKRIQGFESVQVTQFRHFRDGSIMVGYEIVGSSSTSKLLSALQQVAQDAKAALHQLFALEDSSFRVFEKALCNSVIFGFGSMDDEYTLPCSTGYTGQITAKCQSSGWQVTRETCVLPQLEELEKNFGVMASSATEAAVSSLVQNLSVILQKNPSTTAGNLASVVSILGSVSSLSLASHFRVSSSTMEDVINIADHILNSASVANWTVLLQEGKPASSQLLKILENISILMESNLSQPQCVFWDFRRLQWNDAGCHLVSETSDSVTCGCTHLTSFSMLMSPSVPPPVVPVLKWITYMGLGISIGSLFLCLVIEALFWKQIKKSQTSHTHHICLVNAALSLLIADVWFIVADTVGTTVNPSGVCTAAVFFTHFFYLSLFFWMLLLGILLAYRIVLVFHYVALPLMLASGLCLGYGCPLIISVITIAITQPTNSYKRQDVCWLNWSKGSKPLLAFVVPALTIVAVNLVVVLLVLRKLWRPAVGERLNQDDKATAIRMGKSLLILTPLLGLTWGFGIGTMVDSQNLGWHVIFALLNAFQGFFILCFGILLDSKLRQLLFNKLSPLNSWKQRTKQNSDLSPKPKFSKPFNPLQNKGNYVLSHTGPSSKDVMLTQFSSTE
ncbi:adhesion G-protein coupled receptor F1 isoform X4 [Nycticebus coucang]|uniref:adhesion G-protein coupled receptor F1 isoform X4 n=1 Tax=Nycticebus coucang TaxID=9470 RepID=UPI00234CFF8D|nr:adhesion G-protein coupled receptor F1 isoform X4 [Nycticebus coucang]